MGKKVLVVAPHADDETLGAGGTISRLVSQGHRVSVAIMTGHGEEPHPFWPKEVWQEVRAEAIQAHAILGVHETLFREIPAVRVADEPVWKVNKIVDEVVREVEPEILFVPFPLDLHKDHRELFHAFSVAWRTVNAHGRRIKRIYAYEVPSETHLNIPYVEQAFVPTYWTDIAGEHLAKKIEALRCFRSQMRPFPDLRSIETIEALARWRGAAIGTTAAESFVTIRHIAD